MELEEAIRQRAYFIWLTEGGGDGHADAHWLAAEHEILIASMEAAARVMTTSDLEQPASKTKLKRRVIHVARKIAPISQELMKAPPPRRPRKSPSKSRLRISPSLN
jgi:hypothetical protein